jgi:ATP-dependent Clp endopeptidase proteolytic subunit ClpP
MMYCVDPTADEPIMLINQHIGNDAEDGQGIDGALFQRELLELDAMNKSRIQVWINSPGGSVLDGYAIFNAITHSRTKVDTYCYGMAASIAGVIFQAGRRRYMADYGVLMYHNPFGSDNQGLMDAMTDSIITMISSKSGMDKAQTQRMMARETYLTADEAIQYKLADRIEVSSDFNRKRMQAVTNASTREVWKEAAQIMNNVLKSPMSMKNIANKLNLNEDASEKAVIDSISEIQNKLTAAEAKNKADEAALEQAKADLADAQAKYDALSAEKVTKETELADVQNKLTQREDEIATARATKLVEDSIELGQVKNDAKTAWIAKAKADFDGTKALLAGVPINKTAVKIDVDAHKKGIDPKAPDNVSAGVEMANLSNKLGIK